MDDGDHRLLGRVDPPSSRRFLMDYFECGPSLHSVPSTSVLTVSPSPELKLRLETASAFSEADQLRRTYPRRRVTLPIAGDLKITM